MNDARFGTFAALHFAGYQPHAAGTAVAGATVIRQVDAVVESSVQQHLAAARLEALAIDGDFVTSCHYPIRLIPEDFQVSNLPLVRMIRRCCASWDAQQTKRLGVWRPARIVRQQPKSRARVELPVFAELEIETFLGKRQLRK